MKTTSDTALLRQQILSGKASPSEWDEFNLAAFSDPSLLKELDAALGASLSETATEPLPETEMEVRTALEVGTERSTTAGLISILTGSCTVQRAVVCRIDHPRSIKLFISCSSPRDQRVLARRASGILKGRWRSWYEDLTDGWHSMWYSKWSPANERVDTYFEHKRSWWACLFSERQQSAGCLRDIFAAKISHWFATKPQLKLPWDEHWDRRNEPANMLAEGPLTHWERPPLLARLWETLHTHLFLGGMGVCALTLMAFAEPKLVESILPRLQRSPVSRRTEDALPREPRDFAGELAFKGPTLDTPVPGEDPWWEKQKNASREAFLRGAPAGLALSPVPKLMARLTAHVPFPEPEETLEKVTAVALAHDIGAWSGIRDEKPLTWRSREWYAKYFFSVIVPHASFTPTCSHIDVSRAAEVRDLIDCGLSVSVQHSKESCTPFVVLSPDGIVHAEGRRQQKPENIRAVERTVEAKNSLMVARFYQGIGKNKAAAIYLNEALKFGSPEVSAEARTRLAELGVAEAEGAERTANDEPNARIRHVAEPLEGNSKIALTWLWLAGPRIHESAHIVCYEDGFVFQSSYADYALAADLAGLHTKSGIQSRLHAPDMARLWIEKNTVEEFDLECLAKLAEIPQLAGTHAPAGKPLWWPKDLQILRQYLEAERPRSWAACYYGHIHINNLAERSRAPTYIEVSHKNVVSKNIEREQW